VCIAGRQLRPGIADANYRTPVKQMIGQSLILHPTPVDEPIAIPRTKPG
jgi:hypothetical protein